MPSITDQLKQVPLFQSLNSKSIDRLSRIARERNFKDGDAIVTEGGPGVGFFMITEGTVEVTRGNVNLNTLKAGDYFGEMGLLEEGHRRSATVTAKGPVKTLAMMRSDFVAELESNAQLAVEILSTMSKRLSQTDARIAEYER
jgi:CRP-like cAMP-binding protein